MFVTSGSTGSYSASVFSPGDYYLVLEHGAAYSSQAQNVQLSWTLEGMNPDWLALGISVVVIGVVLCSLGYLKRCGALLPPSPTYVIMFASLTPEDPPPPQTRDGNLEESL